MLKTWGEKKERGKKKYVQGSCRTIIINIRRVNVFLSPFVICLVSEYYICEKLYIRRNPPTHTPKTKIVKHLEKREKRIQNEEELSLKLFKCLKVCNKQ